MKQHYQCGEQFDHGPYPSTKASVMPRAPVRNQALKMYFTTFKAALCLVLAGTSSTAFAEADWRLVGGNLDDSLVYLDRSRLVKQGDLVRAWTVQNYKRTQTLPNGTDWQSMLSQDEYDCKSWTTRGLSVFLYSEHYGKGTVAGMAQDAEPTAKQWPPDSAADRTLVVICARQDANRRLKSPQK